MRGSWRGLLCFGLLSCLAGCSDRSPPRVPHVARTSGGAVALSYDERVAVVTNRSAGLVTVLSLKPERGLESMVTSTELIDVGEDSEPWAAVIGADDDTAYVVLRKAQQLVRIQHLHDHPVKDPDAPLSLGSEPESIAISPTGQLLFVGNWGEGTLSMFRTAPFQEAREPLDLNTLLVEEQVLGDLPARPGLAHPGALVISDDGDQDDDDETIYATEFFSQPIPLASKELAKVDSNRQGFVYSLALGSGQANPPMPISPVQDTGFADSNGNHTACFPNQLKSAAIDNGRLYVTATCTSPAGPLNSVPSPTADGPPNDANFKTLSHPAVFVIGLGRGDERAEEARLLTRVLDAAYAADGAGADVRMPLIPSDVAFTPPRDGTHSAYVLSVGADAVFRLPYGDDGALRDIGSAGHRYVGALPDHGYATGLALSQRSQPAFGLALSDVTQQLSVLDLAKDTILPDRIPTTAGNARAEAVKSSDANRGRGLFATGLGVWSYKGQAWSSCESCHPNGLSDGVTWYFARGPRRTLSPANTYRKAAASGDQERRLLLWGANVDEIHDVEAIVRSVSGGAGAVSWQYAPQGQPSNDCRIVYDGRALPQSGAGLCKQAKHASHLLNGLNGSLASIVDAHGCAPDDAVCDSSVNADWNAIDAYIRALRVPRPPTGLDPHKVTAGRDLFTKARCGDCHGGPQWTLSTLFYQPGAEENGSAPWSKPADGATPPALGKLRQDTYAVPSALAALNPSAATSTRADCPSGSSCTTFRAAPKDDSLAEALALVYASDADASAKAASNEQVRCALRDVGTFPSQANGMLATGVAPAGQSAPVEYRDDSSSLAQGADGFGIPSLFGLAVGAPYFHAGNARTLEELFDDAFRAHHESLSGDASVIGGGGLQNLIAFLLSIDETTAPVSPASGLDFCRARTAR